jgi:hypothetical protein
MVKAVREMLKIHEGDRPTFKDLKKKLCPDMELRDKAEQAYEFEVVKDPFKFQMEQRRRQMEIQRQKMT